MNVIPHPKLKRNYAGQTVRTLYQMSNGYVTIPAGELATIRSQSSHGSELQFVPCSCCGLSAKVSHVQADAIEFVEAAVVAA